jgi:secreted PhoX family phosphatase
LGTINNCSHGVTPWNTYLTCEENFNGYFQVEPGSYTAEQQEQTARYGVGGDRNNWATHDDRFVVRPEEPNEPNRFGWVVEINPFDPHSKPVKRTALGRLKHESAYVPTAKGGRVVVYTGDDQVNEHVYKFVSKHNWKSARARGRSALDEGTVYVAKFNDDGSGDWLPLVQGRNGTGLRAVKRSRQRRAMTDGTAARAGGKADCATGALGACPSGRSPRGSGPGSPRRWPAPLKRCEPVRPAIANRTPRGRPDHPGG